MFYVHNTKIAMHCRYCIKLNKMIDIFSMIEKQGRKLKHQYLKGAKTLAKDNTDFEPTSGIITKTNHATELATTISCEPPAPDDPNELSSEQLRRQTINKLIVAAPMRFEVTIINLYSTFEFTYWD